VRSENWPDKIEKWHEDSKKWPENNEKWPGRSEKWPDDSENWPGRSEKWPDMTYNESLLVLDRPVTDCRSSLAGSKCSKPRIIVRREE